MSKDKNFTFFSNFCCLNLNSDSKLLKQTAYCIATKKSHQNILESNKFTDRRFQEIQNHNDLDI